MISAAKRSHILAEYTGIDESVFQTLSEDRGTEEFNKLLKEFQLIVSILLKGKPGQLLSFVKKYEKDQIDDEILFRNINSLLEFGRQYDDLSSEDKAKVDKKEIQQELRHFWRIMGIDSVVGGKKPKIKRVVGEISEIMQVCGNLERCALVIDERRKIHKLDDNDIIIDKSAKPEANVSFIGDGAYMNRRNSPWIGMFIASADSDRETLKESCVLFERLILKYSLEIAIILFDYYLTIVEKDAKQQFRFVAWEEFVDRGVRRVKYYASGNFQILHLKKAKDYVKAINNKYDLKTKLLVGRIEDTGYVHGQIELMDGDDFLISDLHGVDGEYKNLSVTELEAAINKENSKSKIDQQSNLKNLIATVGNSKDAIVISPAVGIAVERRSRRIDKEAILKALAPLFNHIDSLSKGKKVTISLEGGHVHADREIGAIQVEGMRIAGLISDALTDRYRGGAIVMHHPMIDDDHVVNRFSYTKYREYAKQSGYQIDELIFESSPLIRRIAFDILVDLIINEHGPNYELEYRGNNLYISLGNGKHIELLEDIDGECTVGCVLFDTGLTLYRKYYRRLRSVYLKELEAITSQSQFEKLKNIHEFQESLYNKISNADERDEIFELEFGSIIKVADDLKTKETPYISAARESSEDDENIVINVLEGFYQAQQNKLNALFNAIGIKPNLWTLNFDEYGNLELNTGVKDEE